ncbi:MAG TPA: hypothetical protein PLJ21_09190 [Pseudobdellovibrionaceae bacterium]|nr:hypothetical protein [Pseudobdellovibrionaceae bacterium]
MKGKEDLNALFGSKPGYVGSEEIREFEQALMKNPNGGVLVFDELSNMGGSSKEEKNALFKQLYEIFEEGRWHSSQTNTTYDLSKYVIINTGNDSEKLFQGIGADDLRLATWKDESKPEKVFALLSESGVPEAFLGRMAGLFMMKPLLKDESSEIAEKLLSQSFKKVIEDLGIEIVYDQKFLEQFTKTFFSQNQGGRSLRNVIDNRVIGLVAMLVVNNGGLRSVEGKKIQLFIEDNLRIEPFVLKPPPKRSVQIKAVLLGENNQVISVRSDELNDIAPEVLKMSLKQALNTAYHEAGHAIVNNPEFTGQKVKFITINGQGNYLGYARYEDLSEGMFRGDMTEEVMLHWLARLYAGRRAELLAGFKETTGWRSDREKANDILTKYLIDSGMHSELTGMRFVGGKFDPTPQQKKIIDHELKRYTEKAIKMADEMLVKNWHLIRSIVARIIKTGVLREEDFDRILLEVQRPVGYEWKKAENLEIVTRLKLGLKTKKSTESKSKLKCSPIFKS